MTIDVLVTLLFVAAAVGFLAWNLVARERKPACHVGKNDVAAAVPEVVVGASLARGLERARKSRAS